MLTLQTYALVASGPLGPVLLKSTPDRRTAGHLRAILLATGYAPETIWVASPGDVVLPTPVK